MNTKHLPSFQRVLLSPVQMWTTFASVEPLPQRKKRFQWIAATAGTQPSNSHPAPTAQITAMSFLHSAEWCSRQSITSCFRWDCTIIPTPQCHDLPKDTQESRLPHAHSCWAPPPLLSSVCVSVVGLPSQPKCLQSHPRQVERVTPLCHLIAKWGKAATTGSPGHTGIRLHCNLKDLAGKATECW